jgi:hypothetical protein
MVFLLPAVSIAFGLLTVLNLHRMFFGKFSSNRAVSRDTITDVTEMPRVVGHRMVSRGVLELQLSRTNGANSWMVTPDEGEPYEVKTPFPQVKMLDRYHTFQVEAKESGISFAFTIDYCPTEVYAEAGQTHPDDNYFISQIDLPVWKNETHSLDDWCGWDLKEKELSRAGELVKEALDEGMTTAGQIEAVGKWLLDRLDNRRGIPSDQMQGASPLGMFELADSGVSGIWCGNFAQIYYLFANSAGIRTRLVSVGGMLDGVKYSGHGFCESYLPEKGRWACVDVHSKILLMRDRDGRELNTLDLAEILRANSVAANAVVYKEGEVETVDYQEVCRSHQTYFNENSIFLFRLKQGSRGKVARYFTRPRTLAASNHDIPCDNGTRRALIGAWAVTAAGLVVSVIWQAIG